MKCIEYLLLLFLLILSKKLTSGFKAAVFEHAQQSYTSSRVPKDIVQKNLEYYKTAANFAKSKNVQVIVFPEYGIIPDINSRKEMKKYLENIPDPKRTTNPCKEPEIYSDRPILYTISCLARKNRMIIIANMGDIQPCRGKRKCPKDGVFHFNTNVAFGRDGKILSKYHKEHLFDESGMDLPPLQQDPTFKTDLGIFATFVCFDIVFKRITEVAHLRNVTAIMLPTMWLNSSPMLASFQYFESWAFVNNITLLAANIHLPGMSAIGSGIMKGREGAQVYTFNPDGKSKLLISDLANGNPKHSSIYIVNKNGVKEWTEDGKDVGNACSNKVLKPFTNIYKDYRCLERDTANFTLAKLNKTSDHVELCHNGMCCILNYTANNMSENFYLGVFNGSFNAINRYFFAEENCFVARCDNFKNKKCVTFPMRSKTLFYKTDLSANFSTKFVYPTVMDSGMRLTPVNQWNYKSSNNKTSVTFTHPSGRRLLMVGLKGRAYQRDPPYVK